MNRRRWLGYAAIAGGAALVGYAVLAGPSDEERIRGQLQALAHAVSSSEPVSNVVFRASYLRERFEEVLAPDVHIDVPEVGSLPSDHKSLALATARVQTGFGVFQVEIGELDIEVGASGGNQPSGASPEESATARGRVELTATGSLGREEERDVVFHLAKQSGTWLVTAIHVAPQKSVLRSSAGDPDPGRRGAMLLASPGRVL